MNMRAILLATTCAGLAAPAWAAESDTSVAELVVTAQKREERLLDVPLSVQALSPAQLEREAITKVSDLVKIIPGASVVSASTPGFETIQIRGIASGTTGDGLVSYYVGDTPFGIPNLQLTPPARLLDLERVEIIRGPSATLYGQGAMGGTIKMVLAQPDSTRFSGKVQAETSSTSGGGANLNGDVVVNVPLVEGKLAARLSAGYDKLSGFADAPELKERNVNEFRGENVRASLGWTPSDDVTVSGMYWRIRNRQDFSNGLTPVNAYSSIALYFPVPYRRLDIAGTGGRRGYTNVDADVFSLTADWSTPLGNLTVNTSYIDHELDFLAPLLTILVNDSTFSTRSHTNEVRFTSPQDSPVKWLVGASNRLAKIHSDIFYYSQFTPTGPKGSIINTDSVIRTDSYSVFGEASVDLMDGRLTPLLGLSYFEDDRTAKGVDRATGAARNSAGNWNSLNPRFNLRYRPADNGNIYLNIAKGFRSGSLQTPAQAAAADVTLGLPAGTISPTNKPDSLWTYEVGTRWELADRNLLVEGSVYQTDWQDVLVQFATAAVISITNAGDARIRGADIGLAWRTPVDGLTLQASAAYNDAKFTSVLGNLSLGTAIRVGGPVPNVPKTTFNLAADFKREIPGMSGAVGNIYVGYYNRSHTFDATVKNLKSGQLDDLTVRAGVSKDKWSAEAFILNALNDDDPAVLSSTSEQILYPRRIGIRLGYSF